MKLIVDVDNALDDRAVDAIVEAIERIEGVKSARVDPDETPYTERTSFYADPE